MILFVSDQVAGAEYLVPVLLELKSKEIFWKIVASEVSARVFDLHGIECEVMFEPSKERALAFINSKNFTYAILSTSTESKLERSFALALQEKKILYAQFIDQWVNYKSRFLFEGKQLFPNKILTLDAMAKTDMIAEGIPENLIEIIGQPYLEFQTKKNILLLDQNTASKKKLLLISQPISKFYGNSLGFTEFHFLETACEAWKKLNADFSAITIAIHPLEKKEKYLALAQKYSPNISFYEGAKTNAESLPITTFSHVLGIFSSLMTQSVLIGVNTASLQPGAVGQDLCFLSQKGYIPKLENSDQCIDFLSSPSGIAVPEQLNNAIHGSTERLKNFILKMK